MELPPLPANVRLATPSDLPRLALIATASYVSAPQFPYMYPYFPAYPSDCIAGFQAGYRDNLLDSKAAVLVVEEEVNMEEGEYVCEELKELWPRFGAWEEEGGKVVVACTSLAVPEGCEWAVRRREQGVPQDIPPVESLQRHVNEEGVRLIGETVGAMFKKNRGNRATISTMVVHPAYRGKRHGDTLMEAVKAFFTQQGAGYYLAATPGGKKLYLRHGAREAGVVEVPGYSEHPRSFTISMCEWAPGG